MNILQKKRKELGITQLQAANACGVSLRTYQTYEETVLLNATFDALVKRLDELGVLDGSNHLVSVKGIKFACRQLFKEKYPEVRCAYLYGSYARGNATGKSDIDILIVSSKPIGMRFFGIAGDLQEMLNKQIDLQSYEQLLGNPEMLKDVLIEGIKLYGR